MELKPKRLEKGLEQTVDHAKTKSCRSSFEKVSCLIWQ